ncbi:hypothetical protein MKW92_035417 [Papaver armeniacum]|nr:hypothetical protein MKW92_035417 [Papaver armeniacum]
MEEIQLQEHDSSTTSSNGRNFFTCEICVQIMSGCLHPYCTDCVAKYIQEKVIEHNMSEIKCANPDCNVIFGRFLKWCRVLCESVVLLDSSKGGLAYGRSYCPFRDCSELILNDNGGSISNCPNCKKLLCFHYWCDVQIVSVMLSITEVVLPSNAGVKPNFATAVEVRYVYASTSGANVCCICLCY